MTGGVGNARPDVERISEALFEANTKAQLVLKSMWDRYLVYNPKLGP